MNLSCFKINKGYTKLINPLVETVDHFPNLLTSKEDEIAVINPLYFNYFHWIGVYPERDRFQIVCGVHLDNWISALLGNAQQRKRSTIGRERDMAYGWPSSPIFSGVRSCLR